jgi:hypothetical protein
MTHIDEAEANDPWVGALRSDYEPAPNVARERIEARLVGAGLAAIAVGGAVAMAKVAPRSFWYSKAFVALATLPVGIAMGVAGHAWLARPAVVPVAGQRSPAAPVVVASAPAVVALDSLPPLEEIEAPPATAKARPPSAASVASAIGAGAGAPAASTSSAASVTSAAAAEPGLEHELRLLEQARTKLSEGQPALALERLRQHRTQYPQSALEQEREALSVRALMDTGRRAEAQKRAAAFVQRYPSSVLRGSVERAVGTIP